MVVQISFAFILELTLISIMVTNNIPAFIHIWDADIRIASQQINIAPQHIHIQNVEMW